jgi:hypothetical protein
MEVPDWLMKPTKNNKDHIKLLAMIEHVQRAAERIGLDPFLAAQIKRLDKAFLEHSKETVDLDENPVVEALEKNKKKTLIYGAITLSAILLPYILVTKTNILHPKPTQCWDFISTREKKQTKVCLLAVDHPYNPGNGDVSVVLSLNKDKGKEVIVNSVFWIADEIGNRKVDYSGEFNITRTRIYHNGMLIQDDPTEWSSWVKPMIPDDLVMPLWSAIDKEERNLNYSKPLLEDQVLKIVQDIGALAAALGSIGYTLWKFFQKT